MSIIFLRFVCIFIFGFGPLSQAAAAAPTPSKIKAVYNSLDPRSLSQHLAFYELYPDSPEGQQALRDAWNLVSGTLPPQAKAAPLPTWPTTIDAVVTLVNKQPDEQTHYLQPTELEGIEHLAQALPHRKLRGHGATTESEVLALPTEQIDLARGLLLSQLPPGPDQMARIRSYEASLDLMALQILTRISFTDTPEVKIRAINDFIFDEMGFRFPPHSLYAKDIDLYTFLPTVLDSRKGVCLGVSILYICLAQRLDLPLEMITPPGHIFVRYRKGDHIINIETTARGIHLDSEEYLGLETRALEQRQVKEVIGMAHFNQAATFLQQNAFDRALACYQKALPYMPEDMLLKEFLAYTYLMTGHKEEGEKLLKLVENHVPDYAITKRTIAEDYLSGRVDAEGIKPLFMHVDETRESVLNKRKALEAVVNKYPRFRAGQFGLAATWLQLHRAGEALTVLENCHALDAEDPTVEYYLAALYAERLDDNRAWTHLKQAEALVQARDHNPRTLRDFRKELSMHCPE